MYFLLHGGTSLAPVSKITNLAFFVDSELFWKSQNKNYAGNEE